MVSNREPYGVLKLLKCYEISANLIKSDTCINGANDITHLGNLKYILLHLRLLQR